MSPGHRGAYVVASRRLALPDSGLFQTGQQGFLDVFVPAHIDNTIVQTQPIPEGPHSTDTDPMIGELNAATREEWGLSIHNLLELLTELGGWATREGETVLAKPFEEVQENLS